MLVHFPAFAAMSSEEGKKIEAQCTKGDLIACGDLGALHATGNGGFPLDFSKALELYSKACLGGERRRCQRAGIFAWQGKGAEKSLTRAEELFTKGCELKEGGSCNSLALLRAKGTPDGVGVSASLGEEGLAQAELFEKACAYGSEFGCENTLKVIRKKSLTLSESSRNRIRDLCQAGRLKDCPSF